MCTRRMALATLVLVIYQGLFIDVITRSLYVPVGDTVGAAAVSGARPVLSLVVMVLAFGARLRRRYAAWLLGLRLPP